MTDRVPPRSPRLSRRGFLGLAAAAGGVAAVGHLEAAPRRRLAEEWGALSAFERLHFPQVRLPVVTANGDRVPITIEMGHPMEPAHHITRVIVVNERDPVPLKGIFELTPASGLAHVAFQARIDEGASDVAGHRRVQRPRRLDDHRLGARRRRSRRLLRPRVGQVARGRGRDPPAAPPPAGARPDRPSARRRGARGAAPDAPSEPDRPGAAGRKVRRRVGAVPPPRDGGPVPGHAREPVPAHGRPERRSPDHLPCPRRAGGRPPGRAARTPGASASRRRPGSRYPDGDDVDSLRDRPSFARTTS